MKIKKRKKSSRYHGRGMGSDGGGSRKNRRKSGHKGGIGMSGTGKRADHKKTLILNLYGHNYFGKQGVTSRGTKRDTRLRINVGEIEMHLEKYGKKEKDGYEVNLKDYKILGSGEVKNKLIVKCRQISASAKEKIEKAGGSVSTKEVKKIVTPVVINPKHEKKKAAAEKK
ncbi:uL15 family ribosomal protein [Candidatus Pacearchaeota archaeon]|nr:50S ribosomal protein L15P [uncultured archaeon]MBS3084919.1 uL15 family ribosomal protein [Candidatus Pacearchaeota archaeon]